jgi:hypothetical protein
MNLGVAGAASKRLGAESQQHERHDRNGICVIGVICGRFICVICGRLFCVISASGS